LDKKAVKKGGEIGGTMEFRHGAGIRPRAVFRISFMEGRSRGERLIPAKRTIRHVSMMKFPEPTGVGAE